MLKRRFRLSNNKEFQFVYKNGYKVKGNLGMLIGFKGNEPFKLGIVVSKKIGNAVARNKMKRQVRYIFRTLLPTLQESQISFIFVAFKKSGDFQILKSEIIGMKDKIFSNVK